MASTPARTPICAINSSMTKHLVGEDDIRAFLVFRLFLGHFVQGSQSQSLIVLPGSFVCAYIHILPTTPLLAPKSCLYSTEEKYPIFYLDSFLMKKVKNANALSSLSPSLGLGDNLFVVYPSNKFLFI
jgi:hypothetical protein